MSDTVRILGVAGSLRNASYNRRIVRLLARLAPNGVELIEFDGLAAVEPFDEDCEATAPPGVVQFRTAIDAADGLLVVTPEYNSSIPGHLKNALDWASRAPSVAPYGELKRNAIYGRPAAVISSSLGQFGGTWAAQELRKVLKAMGARVIEEPVVALPSVASAFDDHGRVAPAFEIRMVELLQALAAEVRILRAAGIETSMAIGV